MGGQGDQAFWASSSHHQYSHSPCCLTLVCPSPLHWWVCLSMPQSLCHFCGQGHALCICRYPHRLWQRCQAGTYCLGTHLCLGRVQGIILTPTDFISREDLNTSNQCCNWVDRFRACTGFRFSWGPALGLAATARPQTWSQWTQWTWTTPSWSVPRHRTLTRRRGAGLRALWRRGLGTSSFGRRAYSRCRTGGKTMQMECLSISRHLCGCCRSGGGWICPCCSSYTMSCTVDDSLLQNILSFPGTVKRWSVRKIQAVKPYPGLGIGFGHKPANDGWLTLLWKVCQKWH